MLTLIVPATGTPRERGGETAAPSSRDGRFPIEEISRHLQRIERSRTIFVVPQADIDRWAMADVVSRTFPDAEIVPLEFAPATPLFAVLMGLSRWNPDEELLVVDPAGHLGGPMDEFLAQARQARADGVIATGESRHPRDSHLLEDAEGVTQVAKGRPVSHKALAGLHWFRRCQDFLEASERAVLRNPVQDVPADLEEVWNELILSGKRIASRPASAAPAASRPLGDAPRLAAELGVRREG